MATVTIIGAGMMGSGMCRPARDNGHEVRLVGTPLDRDIIDEARRTGWHITLKRQLPEGVNYYQIEEVSTALAGADLVICGVAALACGCRVDSAGAAPGCWRCRDHACLVRRICADDVSALPENCLPESKRGRILFNAIGGRAHLTN